MDLDDIVGLKDNESAPRMWYEWKDLFLEKGLRILTDDSGHKGTVVLDYSEAKFAVSRCTIETFVPEASASPDEEIEQWCKEYDELQNNPPREGDFLITHDKQPIRLNIELRKGYEPFIFGRAYIPKKVGEPLGWFAYSLNDARNYGWKVVLDNRSRDEVLKRFGLRQRTIGVQTLRIKGQSISGGCLIAEVETW